MLQGSGELVAASGRVECDGFDRPKADGTAMRQQMGFLPKIYSPTFLSQGKIVQPAPELEEMYCSLFKVVLTLDPVKRELGSRFELRKRLSMSRRVSQCRVLSGERFS